MMRDDHDNVTKPNPLMIISRVSLFAIAYCLCNRWEVEVAMLVALHPELIEIKRIYKSYNRTRKQKCATVEGSTTMGSRIHQHRAFDGDSTTTATVDPASASTSTAMLEIGCLLDDDGNNNHANDESNKRRNIHHPEGLFVGGEPKQGKDSSQNLPHLRTMTICKSIIA